MRFDEIKTMIPSAPDWRIDWDAWRKTEFEQHIRQMEATGQNPEWHAEGDVWTHTKMVCEALVTDEEFRGQSRKRQEILFLSALMHDIAKPICTTLENGKLTSPHHTATGAKLARVFLWTEWELCGTEDAQATREAICTLIRYHGTPVFLDADERSERKLIRIASLCGLLPNFSLEMLKILVRADTRGRISGNTEERLCDVEVVFMLAQELGIMNKKYPFPDKITEHAYLSGRNVPRDYPLYDDTWREVILVSGLPGTGKDTWIRTHYPHLPVISLDELRRELKISPTDKDGQGVVIARAKELARSFLRKKQPFVWNATNITPTVRATQLSLFEGYRAYTRVIFLETALDTEMERNHSRKSAVPEHVILDMLKKTEPPTPMEAHSVTWVTT